jgi:triacylglycerol lipase
MKPPGRYNEPAQSNSSPRNLSTWSTTAKTKDGLDSCPVVGRSAFLASPLAVSSTYAQQLTTIDHRTNGHQIHLTEIHCLFMSSSYPLNFDKNRAVELGTLVDAAYTQYNQLATGGNTWQPAGYQVKDILQAQENGVLVPYGFVATKGMDAYVVIRGTLSPLEWLEDATILPVPFAPNWGNTTQGFKGIYNQLSPTINQAIQTLTSANAFTALYVTGHSLGAALSHLAAADIYIQQHISPISYTLAGPRTGDPAFTAAFDRVGLQTWRIFNTEDIVPTLPLSTPDLAPLNLGLNETPSEMLLKLLLQHSAAIRAGWLYEHLKIPIPVTFQKGTIADNHNCTNLYSAL